jgi:4-hydroxyphenylpyruvate dioxygenase
MMRWSIATVCLGGGLETKLAAAARAGFRCVEIFENDLTFYPGAARDVRRLADDHGLEIVALQPLRDFEGSPSARRQRAFDRARVKLDLTAELGAPLLCLCSSVAPDALGEPERIADDLSELADIARGSGLRIGYEALSWGRHVRDWTAAWDIVAKADKPNLGIVLDSFHICVRGAPIAPIADLPADRIALVQVSDAPDLTMDPMSLSRHYRCYPGQGDYPIVDYLEAVAKSGYAGPVSLEIFNEQFRGASAASVAVDGMRSLRAAGEALRRRGPTPFPALAPAPEVLGPEFLEFAVGDKDANDLAALFEGLGFARVGAHRSKAVTLFAQGDARFVVNREKGAFAEAFERMHGVSVCAATLKVDDAARAMDRARAMECAPYVGRIGPGEASIPAVGGVEGSLIYFVEDERWRHDFVEAEPTPSGPLTRIDHVSNVVRRSEVLSWALFYKTVLGLEAEPQVEAFDPHGAFYSRALRSPNGAWRLALNVGDGGATGVSRFIETFGGAGYQQIALATDDIFAPVEAARAKGVEFLHIADNYYDDLATRFDIAPDLLARMRRLGVLYDRIGEGEFLHIYTANFRNRFFFEIVQRRGYDGFGAANTPARLAAQAYLDEARLAVRSAATA